MILHELYLSEEHIAVLHEAIAGKPKGVLGDAKANLRIVLDRIKSERRIAAKLAKRPKVGKDAFVAWLNEDPARLELARKRCCEIEAQTIGDDTDLLEDLLWDGHPGYAKHTAQECAMEMAASIGSDDNGDYTSIMHELTQTLEERVRS